MKSVRYFLWQAKNRDTKRRSWLMEYSLLASQEDFVLAESKGN